MSWDCKGRVTGPLCPVHFSPKVWFRCCLTMLRKWGDAPPKMLTQTLKLTYLSKHWFMDISWLRLFCSFKGVLYPLKACSTMCVGVLLCNQALCGAVSGCAHHWSHVWRFHHQCQLGFNCSTLFAWVSLFCILEFVFFLILIPFYLQSVLVHSANCV
jgi:hypothetical protein